MDAAVATNRLSFTARDASGQRRFSVRDVAADTMTVQELISDLVPRMGLSSIDSSGKPQVFHAFLERDLRHLAHSEVLADALKDGDEIVLDPDVQAGSVGRA